MLHSKYSDASLLIVGSGSQNALLTRLANENVNITLRSGQSQKDLVDIYQSCKFLVFPSKRRSESLGLIPIEAMMCQVPVISSTIGATADYIKGGMRAFSFSPGNHVELIDSMYKAINLSNEKYIELCSFSAETAVNYSSEKVISELHYTLDLRLNLMGE